MAKIYEQLSSDARIARSKVLSSGNFNQLKEATRELAAVVVNLLETLKAEEKKT